MGDRTDRSSGASEAIDLPQVAVRAEAVDCRRIGRAVGQADAIAIAVRESAAQRQRAAAATNA